MSEVVVEKRLGKYRLPDDAVDLETWLRDGLEVYNLFVMMKPLFFEMLEALGGEFKASNLKMNEDPHTRRLLIRQVEVGKPGDEGYDHLTIASLSDGDPRDPGVEEMRALLLDIWCSRPLVDSWPEELRKRVERVISPEAAD
jgi:hypothetical protein